MRGRHRYEIDESFLAVPAEERAVEWGACLQRGSDAIGVSRFGTSACLASRSDSIVWMKEKRLGEVKGEKGELVGGILGGRPSAGSRIDVQGGGSGLLAARL